MRKLFLLLGLLMVFMGSLGAQPLAPRPRAEVPAAMDVAGVHLVLNEGARRLVQQKADGLRRHQPSFQARVDLADAAFPIIDRVLKEEGVPLDFRYLAIQESALQGKARSSSEAVGYWQLKQETATGLGLTVNSAVDERQHLAASTRAAARYLTRSNAGLRNWMNALLSYYTGLTGVKPYTLPIDVDATEMTITEATSPYVLAFLAHKFAFEPVCGLNPRPKLLLQEFPAGAGQTLYEQALTLHVDSAALATHNPWLLATTVPADKAYTLIVPVGDVTQAAGIVANQRLQSRGQLINAPAVALNAAEVRLNNLRALIALPGETMADLARRGHQRLGEFLKHNELSGFDAVVTGRPYFLQRKRDVGAVEYHVVQPGERIFDVAQKYGMRQKSIYAKNRMARVEELRPGRVLWLQHTRPRETAIEYRSLPEGIALERTRAKITAAEAETDGLVNQANEAVAARLTESGREGKVKVKIKTKGANGKTKRVTTESTDGWGEALETATATAVVVPAAAPVPVATASVAPVATAPVATPPVALAPVAPAPVSVAPAPTQPSSARKTYLPPPAAAPAPAPLADEPRQPDSTAAVAPPSRPKPAAAPQPAPVVPAVAPKPAPVKAVVLVAAPAPVAAVLVAAPVAAAPVAAAAVAPAPKPAVAAVRAIPSDATHRVEARETVYSVGRLYNIPPATLIAINQLAPPYGLILGQMLTLKAPEQQPAPAAKATPVTVPATTPVAKVAPVTAPAPAPASASQAAGQINPALLYVPKKAASATPVSVVPAASVGEKPVQHTVVKGETLYSISRLYQVTVAELQAWNGKAEEDKSARIGEVLRVSAAAK